MASLRFPNQILYFFHFFLLQFASYCSSLVPLCNYDQSSALLHFKNSFHLDRSASVYEPSYPKTKSWQNGTNCCLWDGVTCDTISGHVIGLDLRSSWLSGQFHPNCTLFQLVHLQRLNLADNYFYLSPIPSQLGELVTLKHLNLSMSGFGGEIPSKISQLSKLVSLDFSGNFELRVEPFAWNKLIQNVTNLRELGLDLVNMSSIKPTSLSLLTNLSSTLVFLHLSFTGLQGNLANDILFLPNIQELDLSLNNFSGEIPSWLSNLQHLTFLGLATNNFSGEIPSWLSNLQHLTFLDLATNNFSGEIPSWLSNLQHLAYLDLSENNFRGQFPPSLFGLTQLSSLYCSNNRLIGPIPHNISRFSILESVDLSNNLLNGTIPSWCFSLPSLLSLWLGSNKLTGNIVEFSTKSLRIIDLSQNKLQGNIPKSMFDLLNLTFLSLSSNNLSGLIDLPWRKMEFIDLSSNMLTGEIASKVCNASSLNILNLSHNNLTGLIPLCLGTLPSLSVLDLQMNNLQGTIPDKFSKRNMLQTLKLSGNNLVGPLPQSLINSEQLEVLDLGNNNLEDAFPNWLDGLQELEVLILRANKFHGTIAHSKSEHPFPKLRIFDVSNNHFNGPLPTEYVENFEGMTTCNDCPTGLQYIEESTNYLYYDSVLITFKGIYREMERILVTFTTIDLSNNMFEGNIPASIGQLYLLKGLNLSHNRISGAIPKSVGGLKNLEWLDLSSNRLAGKIPLELSNLNFLSILNLSHNQLVGIIPRGGQFNTFLNDSYEDNSGLCGFPLSKICDNDDGAKLPPSATFHSEEESGFGWKAVAVGYGCGVVFGALLGYIVFLTGKPQWLVRIVEDEQTRRVKGIRSRARAKVGRLISK